MNHADIEAAVAGFDGKELLGHRVERLDDERDVFLAAYDGPGSMVADATGDSLDDATRKLAAKLAKLIKEA